MANLQIAVENNLSKEDELITDYKRFRDPLTTKIAGETSDTFYQGIKIIVTTEMSNKLGPYTLI